MTVPLFLDNLRLQPVFVLLQSRENRFSAQINSQKTFLFIAVFGYFSSTVDSCKLISLNLAQRGKFRFHFLTNHWNFNDFRDFSQTFSKYFRHDRNPFFPASQKPTVSNVFEHIKRTALLRSLIENHPAISYVAALSNHRRCFPLILL